MEGIKWNTKQWYNGVPPTFDNYAPDWSLEQCDQWLDMNERHIQNRLVELGWEVISTLLPANFPVH